MKYFNMINKVLIVAIIVGVITLIVGLTYAYFTAGITGNEEATTITARSGKMELVFDGGPGITSNDMEPSISPFATKTFTITGTNNVGGDMSYDILFIIDINTFTPYSISYTLEGTNVGGNGTIASNIIERTGLTTANKKLGTGSFTGKITNKVHSYTLNLYFYETGKNQSADMNKQFGAHLKIEEATSCDECLSEKIIAQGVNAELPIFAVISPPSPSGIFASLDEYGTSYYYRGLKANLKNNLIFGGFQWKIVRINGDGSIRIIYNGLCPMDECSINNVGTATQIPSYTWNPNNNDNKYVGYMYGGLNGNSSTSREEATTNSVSANVKTQLDAWYASNIANKSTEITSKIVDNIFCNDRQLQNEIGGLATGTGFGASSTNYASLYRLQTIKTPSLKCGLKNDRFTVGDTARGNGALTYPVGLITADELVFAGNGAGSWNGSYYLYNEEASWTLTPATNTSVWVEGGGSLFNDDILDIVGMRPVISLSSEVTVSGDGSTGDPYKVLP